LARERDQTVANGESRAAAVSTETDDRLAPEAGWRKARASAMGNCVEVAPLGGTGDLIGFRDSKDPSGPILRYTKHELRAFIAGVKAGEFDDLV
jgi:hypothetical protein